MKGSYVLVIRLLQDEKIKVGALGDIEFKKGYYAYVGSAMNGIEKRVARHGRRGKKLRWHIDYLTEKAFIEEIWYKEGAKEECKFADYFRHAGLEFIPNFGSGDCKCKSHLFYDTGKDRIHGILIKAGMKRM